MIAQHPSFHQLRAFAAGELAGRGRFAEHLRDCASCRTAVASIREVLSVAREEFSPSAPPHTLDRILARRANGDRVLLPTADGRHGKPRLHRTTRIALVTAGLLTIAGLAAAVPGSPLREWIARSEPRPVENAQQPASPAAVATAISGVALVVVPGDMWVGIDADPGRVRIRVRVTEGTRIEVRGTGAAASAEFRPRADGIGVASIPSGDGEIQVDVPRSTERFVLRVRDVPFLIKEGTRLRVLSSADTMGTELLFSPSVRP
ncbi:MAG TPA: hypothetical protein VEB19_01470 [Gemmatimonadaceae bacterium]|nr:hypothetical protein [Gemmatimonadaceae bacterium]